jgi:hypothetical protein
MADVVLEPAGEPPQGMPTGTTQPEPEPEPLPLSDEDAPPPEEDEEPEPQGRRSLVGDLVRERERRATAEEQARSAQELLQSVMQHPEGFKLLQQAASGQPPAPAEDDQTALAQELEATAIDLGLYDAQGQPDLQSAARIMAREQRRIDAQVTKAVEQLKQTELLPLKQQRAEQTIAHVKAVAVHYGIDPVMVERGMRTLPLNQLDNPEVQQTVLMTALGLQTFGAGGAPPQQQPQYGPPQPQGRRALRPPIYQEPSGGRPRGQAPVIDEPFRVRLRESGLKDADIDASLSRFVAGAPNRLE